jgi:hypothetical protein
MAQTGTVALAFAEVLGPNLVADGDFSAGLGRWRLPALQDLDVELVLNGDFPTDLASWALTGTVPTWVSGAMRCSSSGGDSVGSQDMTVVVGQKYRVLFDVVTVNGQYSFRIGSTAGGAGGEYLSFIPLVGALQTRDVRAVTALLSVRAAVSGLAGGTLTVDNVSVRKYIDSVSIVAGKAHFTRAVGLVAGSAYLLQRKYLEAGRYRMTALLAGTPGTLKLLALDGSVVASVSGDDETVTADFIVDVDGFYDVGPGFTAAASEVVALDVDDVTLRPFAHLSDASVVVTGQTAIEAGAHVDVWLQGDATGDHGADEHLVETLSLRAGDVVPGVGFTVYGVVDYGGATGEYQVRWAWKNAP